MSLSKSLKDRQLQFSKTETFQKAPQGTHKLTCAQEEYDEVLDEVHNAR